MSMKGPGRFTARAREPLHAFPTSENLRQRQCLKDELSGFSVGHGAQTIPGPKGTLGAAANGSTHQRCPVTQGTP
ncbi:hypothetical protein GCM10012319_14070 [Comamonas sp. KCTC 72670]|nr:hypothetical protein GCM10012319_14070 [Comamonas sp. KCTC 72670]